jgi:hypothetical protein
VRAVNISLDGKAKRRYDQLHRDQGLIASTDTVDTHTHCEFWRDTEGNRQATLDRMVALMRAAVAGTTPPPATTGGNDMGTLEGDQARRLTNLDQFVFAIVNGDPVAHGVTSPGWTGSDRPVWLTAKVSEIAADAKASRLAVEALSAAINKGGGSVDSAAIIAHMDQLAASETGREQDMLARIGELEAELEQARQAQHDAAQAVVDATADKA